MQRVGVGCGVNACDRDAEPVAGARDPAGYFTAIGDQDFLEHYGYPPSSHPEHAELGFPRR
jgi:hypothetical protein